MQAFWWDQFDGLTTSVYDGENWNTPQPAPIPNALLLETPVLLADGASSIHAFWTEEEAGGALLHSHANFGSFQWSTPVLIADSVLTFSAVISPEARLSLAYIRTMHTQDFPAGVYVKSLGLNNMAWGQTVSVHASIYYRLLSASQATLNLSTSKDRILHLAWEAPLQNRSMFSMSTDGGFTWRQEERVGDEEIGSINPRLAPTVDGEVLRIWETPTGGSCEMNQQRSSTIYESSDQEPQIVWSNPQRALAGLSNCPTGDRFLQTNGGLFWLWDEGSSNISLSAFDADTSEWSQPVNLNVSVYDDQTLRQIVLSDLHVVDNGRLVVVGADTAAGEVWVTETEEELFDFAYRPLSAWLGPSALTGGNSLSVPVMAIDTRGIVNIVWSQAAGTANTGSTLYFARGRSGGFGAPYSILQGRPDEEMAQKPQLLIDREDKLHVVWSSGIGGEILYSRSVVTEPLSPRDWSLPVVLSDSGFAASPQMGIDAAGRLYIVYAVPLNEKRGIYLLLSEDGGDQWSEPQLIFDAASAGWQMAENPTLVVEPSGAIHVAWVQSYLPGSRPPSGIYYANSIDKGYSWSNPQVLAGDGFDWPRLAVSSNQIHLLYAGINGGVWHRASSQEDHNSANLEWGLPVRVPGWDQVTAPFGVATDGDLSEGSLHLLATTTSLSDARDNTLKYSVWNGLQWINRDSLDAMFRFGPGMGAAAATRPEGGLLAAAWVAMPGASSDTNIPSIYIATREIPTFIILPSASQALPTPTATPTPAPFIQPTLAPTPTPNLNQVPASSGEQFPPLILGSGLAALAVAGVFGMRMLLSKKR